MANKKSTGNKKTQEKGRKGGGATMFAGAAAGAVMGAALGAGAAAALRDTRMRKRLSSTLADVPSYASDALDALQDADEKMYDVHHQVSKPLRKASAAAKKKRAQSKN